MKQIKKLLAVILAILMIMSLTACSLTSFDDMANDAKDKAEGMANDMMDILNGMESIENGIYDYLDTDSTDSVENNNRETIKVIRVIDGDTFMADINGKEVKVRLIGVDTPESVATGDKAYKNCEEGKVASDYTKSIIEGKNVYIEYDVDKEDDYGRTLAYIFLADGTMYNKHLLEKGYARLMTIQPNVKYVDEFTSAQTTARENKEGFWQDFEQWQD